LKENKSAWKDVSTLIKIEVSREIKGILHQETRYYISDETVSNPSYHLSLSRGHWGIENQLHWIWMLLSKKMPVGQEKVMRL
jgi:hypothetical protein